MVTFGRHIWSNAGHIKLLSPVLGDTKPQTYPSSNPVPQGDVSKHPQFHGVTQEHQAMGSHASWWCLERPQTAISLPSLSLSPGASAAKEAHPNPLSEGDPWKEETLVQGDVGSLLLLPPVMLWPKPNSSGFKEHYGRIQVSAAAPLYPQGLCLS